MSIMKILFSFSGRIPRSTWWLSAIGLSVAMGILSIGVMAMTLPNMAALDPNTFNPQETSSAERMALMKNYFIGVGILVLLSLWPSLAISVKRLHDRNWSGKWLLLPYGIYLIPAAILAMNPHLLAFAANPTGAPPSTDPTLMAILGAAVLISAVSGIWLFIMTAFMRGTSGTNRFGEDPLGGMLAEDTPPPGNEWAS